MHSLGWQKKQQEIPATKTRNHAAFLPRIYTAQNILLHEHTLSPSGARTIYAFFPATLFSPSLRAILNSFLEINHFFLREQPF